MRILVTIVKYTWIYILYFILLICVGAQLWYFTLGQVVIVKSPDNKQIKVPFSTIYTLKDIGEKAEVDLRNKANGRSIDASVVYRVKWEAIYKESLKKCDNEKEAVELTNKCLGR